MRRRMRIKSLYIKWVLLFTGLIITSQLFTLTLLMRVVMPELKSGLGQKLLRKAEFIRSLDDQGIEITEEVLQQIGDIDIHFYLFSIDSIPEDMDVYRHDISLDMLNQVSDGDIVVSATDNSGMPFCIFYIDGRIAMLTPNILGNELQAFMRGLSSSVLIGAATGSVLIVIALIVVIRPIRKVNNATKEVANGNFDIKLTTKSVDEVGQLIQNFNQMAKELKKNEYLRKDFVSSVSHEFSTPLTSIEGFAKLLKNEELCKEVVDEYTDIIIKETNRLANLSSKLMKLSLLDSGAKLMKSGFYLDEQIREVILLLESKWADKNIEIKLEIGEIPYYGDQDLLSQVWINLIHNAIKFSPAGGKICITSQINEKEIAVSISDEGPGVGEEHREKIFDRFYKADKSRSKDGSGLGLSIVKRILELCEGSIWLCGEGRGACFTVTLPQTSKREILSATHYRREH